ncbi:MAG: LysM repeat protein [Planctomycetota bacterium]
MRILIGIACLLLVFAVSTFWHRTKITELRIETGLEKIVVAAEKRSFRPGWGEVIVGAPSGVEPIHVEIEAILIPADARRLTPPPGRRGAQQPLDEELARELDIEADEYGAPESELQQAPRDWELEVRSGDVLSSIVRKHYGRVSPDLDQKLAEYNGLSSPDKLKVGQTLYLPTEARLLTGE